MKMYDKVLVYETDCRDPWRNLATERALADLVSPGKLIVFLWINGDSVIIGRHQNAFLDVNVRELHGDGGKLARRLTGGGAVFHDEGNLNFSFLSAPETREKEENYAVIEDAVRVFGLEPVRTGRNDIAVNGRKISGNAFLGTSGFFLHHGTLLISADREKMPRYLRVRPDKLEGKGVTSVASRVANLRDFCPACTAESVKNAVKDALRARYGDVEEGDEGALSGDALERYEGLFSDKDFIFGKDVRLRSAGYRRFSWGYADVRFTLDGGIVREAAVYSDAADSDEIDRAVELIRGADVREPLDTDCVPALDMLALISGAKSFS